jgi:UDP-2,4-diacetamido-2,4,6-trideoxy-beta-L-altropyranose hydrolase
MRESYRPDAPALTIRCDASSSIGGGHVLRCLALAQEWAARGGDAVFVSAAPAALVERMRSEGFGVVELPSPDAGTAAFLDVVADRSGWGVLDGYHYTLEDERRARAIAPLLVLDDYGHRARYSADLLLNQNPTGPLIPYVVDEGAELLLGTAYTLLRREFAASPPRERTVAETATRVLVTLGNGDFPEARDTVLAGLDRIEAAHLEVRLVQGEAATVAAEERERVAVVRGGPQMRRHMEWCDLAVSAGGSTCWELAFMGVPTVALSLADNQRELAASLERAGAGVDLGDAGELEPRTVAAAVTALVRDVPRRTAMSAAGRSLIDGRGAARVVDALLARR